MITINLLPHAEKRAKSNPLGLTPWPLFHQIRTYEALRKYDLVMNTYNTGTGKTIASLLHLHRLHGKRNLRGKNVLFIAPTNALIQQHSEDIQKFVNDYNLDFKVQPITAQTVREIEQSTRPGRTLHHFIRNYLKYEEDTHRRPLILVTNPDIYYYAIFDQYGQNDQRNLFEDFMLRFDYIVIDEFHYYDSKQLANFLFVLAMYDQFGYFKDEYHQRKICLLSATPTSHVRRYLDSIFGDRWTMISPNNEPSESDGLPTIPSLAPLTLTLLPGQLNEWAQENGKQLVAWLDEKQDGAMISSSLWRVNAARQALLPLINAAQMRRITGPETAVSRQSATKAPLILASPTVDIGYNFAKENKKRQNIDFLVCDAHFGDGLVQRIGRAGRVLGKAETNRPSRAIAILPDAAIESLRGLDGQTMTRATFNEQINSCDTLPEKHRLTQYINSHAITECFYPIFKLGATVPPEYHVALEKLFLRVHQLFNASKYVTYQKLKRYYFKYQSRQRWLTETKKRIPHNKETAVHLRDQLKWLYNNEYDIGDIQNQLADILEDEEQQQALRAFVTAQIAITQALFNFRDSFQGPTAVIHDPRHQLSSETINSYDLFHLLRHYQISPQFTNAQFKREFGETTLEGEFYFQIKGWRKEKISLAYRYRSEDDREQFEERWCCRPVGLTGLKIQAKQQGTAVHGLLDKEIVNALAEKCLPVMIISPDDNGMAIACLRGTAVWSQSLTVTFPDGSFEEHYRIFFGKDAFFAHAELRGYFYQKQRQQCEAIII
ncbi:CRISPR-associated helicase Cas3 [hydrothermal vent metagenome]|uniref:CRISPR-associated helicase Cas3 n=1 Tax=hydrothermal vent metagenome TaxID=652676 RepID=A0A3B0V1C0_9ZZZZ